jgi:hypothetical protein
MQDLKSIGTSVLIDMLAQETTSFNQLFRNYPSLKHSHEYQRCKENIQYIILELDNRKKLSKNPQGQITFA